MAYMSQEKKKVIAEKLRTALKGKGLKYSLGVHNHSTIVMRITASAIDFIGNYNATRQSREWGLPEHVRHVPTTCMDVNPYWYKEHFTGEARQVLETIMPILNEGNHDRSDSRTDYFDVGWYVDVKIGQWNKPYTLK